MTGKKYHILFIVVCCWFLAAPGVLWNPAGGISESTSTTAIYGRIYLTAYDIAFTDINATNATVTWKTNDNANSTVEYGMTTDYGSRSTETLMGRTHTVTLYSLSPGTVYHYRILSANLAGIKYQSADATFNTTGSASTGSVVAAANSTTDFEGVTIATVDGDQQVTLSQEDTEGSIEVSGNTVTVQDPGSGWSQVQYFGTGVTTQNGNVVVDQIQKVILQSEPVTAPLGGTIGTASSRINVGLTEFVSDIDIRQEIIQGATAEVTNSFQLAAASSNLDVQAVAYTVQFHNTDAVNSRLSAEAVKLTLGIDHAWVIANAPDGDRNNIRIIRVPDTGPPLVLTTRYTGSQGSTDYFEADSPNGLSIFGVITVAQKSTGTGGGWSNSYQGSSDSSGGGGAVSGAPQQAQAKEKEAPPVQLEQPGPIQSVGITMTQSLSVAGVSTTTGPTGSQTIRVDTARATQSGSTVTVQDTRITISQPGFVLTVTTKDTAAVDNGIVSGTVQSVSMSTSPFPAELSIGTVSVSLDASLGSVPEHAAVTITLLDTASQETRGAFQLAAQSNNRQIEAIAYVMNVGKTNLAVTGPATVTMTVPPDWVMSHGGIETVVISRTGDDQRGELLQTHYTGSDAHGNMVFEGLSPHGLSMFGILTVNAPLKEQQREQAIPAGTSRLSLSQLYTGTITDTILLFRDAMTNKYLLVSILVIFVGGCGALYILWHKRRGQV